LVAWIIYFQEGAVLNNQYIKLYIEEGRKLDIDVRLILVENLEFGVKQNRLFMKYQNNEIEKPDFAICRTIYPLLSKHLEDMGIRVFNNSFVSEICNDKAKTHQYVAKAGIKMVDSSFYKNFQVKDTVSHVVQPTIIKAVAGHGGKQVYLLNPAEDTELNIDCSKVIRGLAGSDAVVQPFTGSRRQDLRVYVLGREIVAAVLRTAKEGFKSNFSLGGEVTLYQLTEEEKQTVNQVIKLFDFDLVGIDFLLGDQGELIFNEIEDVVGSRMLYKCSDINIVEKYLKYMRNCMDGI
jgi:gamma-F420-2:alpha-L-glutamate ligase